MIPFLLLAGLAVATALVVVLHRQPVMQAVALVAHLLAIAGLFGLLGAHFLAVVQVIVYAGAIVVLITFVIMLLNLGPELRGTPGVPTLVVAFLLGALLVVLIGRAGMGFSPPALPAAEGYGGVHALARALFNKYFFPFEVVSLAVLAALAGAVLLAKRNLED